MSIRQPHLEPTPEEILEKVPETILAEEDYKYLLEGKKKAGRPKKVMGRKTNTPGSWFTEEKRIEAVTAYAIYGNAKRVEELTGVPSNTVRQWKMQDWWNEVIQRVRVEKDDELDSKFSQIIDKTLDKVMDAVENGDQIYDIKRGVLVRKPIYAKEGAEIIQKIVDKRQLLRGLPTRRTENTSKEIAERLKLLAKEFEKMVGGHKVIEHDAPLEVIEDVEIIDESQTT